MYKYPKAPPRHKRHITVVSFESGALDVEAKNAVPFLRHRRPAEFRGSIFVPTFVRGFAIEGIANHT